METALYRLMYEKGDTFWLNVGMRKIVRSLLGKYTPHKNNKILDVGCGPGMLFPVLVDFGQVYGVDKSAEAILYARRRRLAKEVIKADAINLPFPDGTFNVIICFDVLYHQWIKDDLTVLKELKRVLSDNGVLIIKEPAYDWLRSQHDELYFAKQRFSKKNIYSKIDSVGFMFEKCSYINFFLFPLALLRRLFLKTNPRENYLNDFLNINKYLNNFLIFFLYLESKIITFTNFPFGLSIICIVKKKNI